MKKAWKKSCGLCYNSRAASSLTFQKLDREHQYESRLPPRQFVAHGYIIERIDNHRRLQRSAESDDHRNGPVQIRLGRRSADFARRVAGRIRPSLGQSESRPLRFGVVERAAQRRGGAAIERRAPRRLAALVA